MVQNASPLYDLSLLNASGKDDPEFVQKILAVFIEIMPQYIAEILNDSANNNFAQVRKTAHKIKSSIELLGISSLKNILVQLETIEDNQPNLPTLVATLDNTMKEVIEQLKLIV